MLTVENIDSGKWRWQVSWNPLTSQGTGFTDPSHGTPVVMYAYIEPLTADETVVADAQMARITHQVITRWAPMKARDNLTYVRNFPDGTSESVTLEIKSVIDVQEMHVYNVLQCVEVK